MTRIADVDLVRLLPKARRGAYAPISNFRVGAVVLGRSGRVYLGANIEIPGESLGLTVHAEQAALANAYMAEEAGIDAIAVTAAPCGHCRQFLFEMAPEGDVRVLVGGQKAVRLTKLLPAAFGPKVLGLQQGAFPVRGVALPRVRSRHVLEAAALEAMGRSYAPYSGSPSGLAFEALGEITAGAYIENAAFNPSLGPLQTALAQFLGSRGKLETISRAVLAERADARIRQANSVRAALRLLAPGARLTVLKVS